MQTDGSFLRLRPEPMKVFSLRSAFCFVTVFCLYLVGLSQVHAETATSKQPLSLPLNVAGELKGDFDELMKRRVIRVLVVPNRTGFFIARGETRGLTYDVFSVFEKFINKKHKTGKLPLKIAFIPVSQEAIVDALNSGRGDIAVARLTVTPERMDLVDFTEPVLQNVEEILVAASGSEPVSSKEELSGKEVFVRKSSSYFQSLSALNADLVNAGKAPVLIHPAPEDLQDEDILEMLQAGLINYTVVDRHLAAFWQHIFPTIKLLPNVALRTGAHYAWMVRKDSPGLLVELNDFIAKNPPGTSDRETLLRKYIKNYRYVKPATSTAAMEKFNLTVDLFKKYADKYSLDYLLVMAQGYQESRLNHNARSPVGAIGIMQLMPATGKELRTGDIHLLEPNIHAGAKYMRLMIDRYYATEPMNDLNKALFCFASYNAGPGRVAKLRAEAGQRGFDSNRWFNNVEVIASERIGQETVRYVSNIYKYYVAYKLVTSAMEKKEAARKML